MSRFPCNCHLAGELDIALCSKRLAIHRWVGQYRTVCVRFFWWGESRLGHRASSSLVTFDRRSDSRSAHGLMAFASYSVRAASSALPRSVQINDIKEKIAEAKQCGISDLRLSFNALDISRPVDERSQELVNSSQLADYQISDGETLDLMVVPGMKFCKECNNMLYPRENRAEKKLYFFCRHCKREEKTDMHCTYRNELKALPERYTPPLATPLHSNEGLGACHLLIILPLIASFDYLMCVFPWSSASSSEKTVNVADLVADPCLPRTSLRQCPRCHHNEVVFYQAPTRSDDRAMMLFFACGNEGCYHRWQAKD